MNAAQPPALLSMAPLLFMLVIFYFLLIRPQQKQAAEHKKMLEALKKGDRVLTSGGLFGTVVALRGPELELKIADNVKVVVARSAVTALANHPELASAQKQQES